jgi:class 3 adenylate cyclase
MPYTERYVVFLDILGFSELVRKTERDGNPARYNALVKTLTEIGSRDGVVDVPGDRFQFQSFSDSIVMSSNASGAGLVFLLYSIEQLAIRLLNNGLLMRGAIAKGKLHHDQVVMFGPAFLEAHRIEATIAKYPRVLLSRETYEDFNAIKLSASQVLLDEDGPPFLHVLLSHCGRDGRHTVPVEGLRDRNYASAANCQKMIQELLGPVFS